MDTNQLADGLIQYLMLVGLLTFHEYGHAWTAMKCGDDTAKHLGRVSLNPIVHIDLIGTVILPLVMIFVPGAGKFLIGWAKPVPVNPNNFRNKNFDDILVTMAGPAVNLILAVGLVALAKAGVLLHSEALMEICIRAAALSLVLCFFNLIPIPPLDGSHVLRVLTGMTWETYLRFSQFGFIAVILLLQIPQVSQTLNAVTIGTLRVLVKIFGL